MMKKILPFLFFIFVALLTLCLICRVFPTNSADVKENNNVYKAFAMDRELFLHQKDNDCASYTAMAVISVLKNQDVNPVRLSEEMMWRSKGGVTFPQGLVNILKNYRINLTEYKMFRFSDSEKINWLKNTIDKGNIIVLFVQGDGLKHYVTVLGYDSHGFLLYDSLQKRRSEHSDLTIVDKSEYEGNRYYPYADLIALWNKGGIFCFFRNWALVCN